MGIETPVIVRVDQASTTGPFLENEATFEPSSSGNGFASAEKVDLAVERFREAMRSTGGRFAEMTPSEETEIIRFLQSHIGPISITSKKT